MNKFRLLDANVGDILYMRRDGKVHAVKVVNYICGSGNTGAVPNASYVTILVAGNGEETEKLYIGRGTSQVFFHSIEDCINNINEVDSVVYDEQLIAQFCGMEPVRLRNCFGGLYIGVKKYAWDGYKPQLVEFGLHEYLLINDINGWHSETYKHSYEKEKKKYYDTYEECLADNHVDVVVF